MKVAVIHPRKGISGLWTPSLDAAITLSAAEVNMAGGILGEPVELVFADCGFTPECAVAAVDRMLDEEQVDAIIGQHTSNVREPINRRVAERVPYIYTSQHEGLNFGTATVLSGITDGELLWPALSWIMNKRRVSKFFFVGNDYVWPRTALDTTRRLIAQDGGEMVGQALFPMHTTDFGDLLQRIKDSGADAVVLALVGECSVYFNREFAAANLDRQAVRLGLLIEENILCGIGARATQGLFTVSNYYASYQTRANDRFLDAYHGAYGPIAPPATSAAVAYYEGLHLLAAVAGHGADPDRRRLSEMARKRMNRTTARRFLDGMPVGRSSRAHVAEADGVKPEIVASFSIN